MPLENNNPMPPAGGSDFLYNPTGRAVPCNQQALMRLMLNSMEEALVVVDAELTIVFYNPAAERLFGYPADLVLGKRFSILYRPMLSGDGGSFSPEKLPVREALVSGRSSPRTLVGLTDDESRIQWVQVGATPWVDPTTRAVTHVGILFENVTARREAESEAALNGQVIDQAADAIVVTDHRGIVLEVNPAFTRLTGFRPEEIVGGTLRVLEHRERDRDRAEFSQMSEALRAGQVWSSRIAHRMRDGSSIDCLGTLSPLFAPNGSLTGFVYMLRDMSRIAEMERRMMSSQKLESIGTLAGGIAHDFNNLLHSISGYAELCLREDVSERARHYLGGVLGACERAGGLVRHILTFSRREERECTPIIARGELEKAVDFVRVTLPATVRLDADIDCDDAAVLGDATELSQIIVNLLTNAYHALPDKAGRLGVRACVRELTEADREEYPNLTFGPYLCIEVSDTGKGIPAHLLGRIFDPFFTTKPVNEGTGMGLSIVHGIVTAMQGDISVTSEVGRGTTFTLLLPMTNLAAQADEALAAGPEPGAERVLLVDDEGGITAMVSEMLTGLGYHVTVRNSGEEALRLVRANPNGFDIVITDQNMPQVTGVRLASLIHGLRPALPVLLCTGNADRDLIEKAGEAGVAHILHKPLRLTTMASIIRSTLDGVEVRSENPNASGLS